jgi:Flp pilus assembly protein TadG
MTVAMRLIGERLRRIGLRLGRQRSGAAAVEMAFLAPILVFLAAGLVDFGLGVYTKMMVADAAQAGAAYAQLNAATYSKNPCTANTPPCPFDQSVTAAATRSHGAATIFSSPVQATAKVLFCCLVNGTVDLANCTEPPNIAPICNPPAGTYVQVSTSATYSTLLPYKFASNMLNLGFNIPNPLTMQANDIVRVQ